MADSLSTRAAQASLSFIRQSISVVMIFFGFLLSANASFGPCGGTALAVEPFPAFWVTLLGFAVIVCSYLVVKSLKVEGDFRRVVYGVFVLWSLTLLFPLGTLVKQGIPRAGDDLGDFQFTLLRGGAAVGCLLLFYRWKGARGLITRIW
jgi:hypothetical protein